MSHVGLAGVGCWRSGWVNDEVVGLKIEVAGPSRVEFMDWPGPGFS